MATQGMHAQWRDDGNQFQERLGGQRLLFWQEGGEARQMGALVIAVAPPHGGMGWARHPDCVQIDSDEIDLVRICSTFSFLPTSSSGLRVRGWCGGGRAGSYRAE